MAYLAFALAAVLVVGRPGTGLAQSVGAPPQVAQAAEPPAPALNQGPPSARSGTAPEGIVSEPQQEPMESETPVGEEGGQIAGEPAEAPQPTEAAAQPAPGEGRPGAEGAAGPGAARPLSEEQVEVQAESVFMTEDVLAGSGGVVVRTQDYTITADTVEINRRTNVGRFRGRVVIEGRNQRAEGEALWIDIDTGWWKLEPAATTVEPEFFAGGVLEPLYARGAEANYDPDKDTVHVSRGEATSCELPKPHYALKSSQVTVRPDDKVTLRRPSLYFFGHRLLQYPFNLTMSLREREQRVFPELGSNDVEGNYLKFAFLYLMGSHNNGVLRLHFTQLRGTGFGFDHLMQDSRQSLFLSLFDEPQEGAQALRLQHDYQFGRTLSSDLSVSYQNSSGFMYASSSLSSDLTFRNTDADSDTTLGLARSLTTTGYGSSSRFAANLYHSQRYGRDTNWNLRSTLTSSNFAAAAASDEELLIDFQYRHRAPSYDMDLYISRRQDLDGSRYQGDSNYYALNRQPALTFRTDSDRLGGWRLLGRSFARFQVDLGSFVQDPQGERIGRLAFLADLGGTERDLGPRTTARTALRFRQSFFDDGSAQYSVSFDSELRRRLGGHWHARVSYDYASTRGFAPLRLDYGGVANDLRLQVVRLSPGSSRLELSGGYDLLRSAYYDVRMLFERRASESLYWRLQTAYSIEQARWWPVVLRLTTAHPSLYLDLSASYDLERSKLSVVTADTDWRIGRWWRVEFVGSYSGWTGALDQADVRLTRDLHCLVAQLTWSKWPRQLYFALGIKAFPSETRMLGVGATGAYLPAMPGGY